MKKKKVKRFLLQCLSFVLICGGVYIGYKLGGFVVSFYVDSAPVRYEGDYCERLLEYYRKSMLSWLYDSPVAEMNHAQQLGICSFNFEKMYVEKNN